MRVSLRCIDYVFYYPNQRLPFSQTCGLGACNGFSGGISGLAAEHDLDRTFGIVDTCTASIVDDAEDAEGTDDAEDAEDAEVSSIDTRRGVLPTSHIYGGGSMGLRGSISYCKFYQNPQQALWSCDLTAQPWYSTLGAHLARRTRELVRRTATPIFVATVPQYPSPPISPRGVGRTAMQARFRLREPAACLDSGRLPCLERQWHS